MSTTYTVTESATTVDNVTSTLVQIQNTGTATIRVTPLGRNVAPGATVTVPGWLTVPTGIYTVGGGATSTAVVTLTSGTPATAPGPGAFVVDPGAAGTLSLSITGGSWFTDEGLKTAVTFPLTVNGKTSIYPAAEASVLLSVTVGGLTKTVGHTVTKGDGGSFTWAPTTEAERAATAVAAGSSTYVADAASPTRQIDGSSDAQRGLTLTKVGRVLNVSGSGFDQGLVESPCVFWDAASQRYGMYYVGYNAGQTTAVIGLAWASSPAGPWVKTGSAVLSGTGVNGDPNKSGYSGPVVVIKGGTYYLFYVGLPLAGYESPGGTVQTCLATATSPTGPWTRRGVVAPAPGGTSWRSLGTWHASIVERTVNGASTYYLFFNATGDDSIERIGYATASSLLGPWAIDDTHSPLIGVGGVGTWDHGFVGDPSIYRVGNIWYMAYFGFDGSYAHDGVAWTTDTAFPLGWTKHSANPILSGGVATEFDGWHAHKPYIFTTPDRHYHYYTAVNETSRTIGLAVTPGQRQTPVICIQEQVRNTTTDNQFSALALTDILFDCSGKTGLRGRLIVRGNPAGSTLTVKAWNHNDMSVTCTGGDWGNFVGPWTTITETATYYDYLAASSTGGIAATVAKAWIEFDHFPI